MKFGSKASKEVDLIPRDEVHWGRRVLRWDTFGSVTGGPAGRHASNWQRELEGFSDCDHGALAH
jgi:hypothetical protein